MHRHPGRGRAAASRSRNHRATKRRHQQGECDGSLAADIFSLPDRGRIAPGRSADLVIFDAEDLSDLATFDDPTRAPSGVHAVWVGGEQVVKDGAYLGRRNGTLLSARH
ncbi:amidohydrolase family protein [Brevibacterium sp. p3-SID960]|uniref:amidohydrolase family protein n=1 Tax=Brevibacterium sp. p3-SID960 TaxID=2916063 RepID=UPI0037BF8FDD